MWSSPNGDSGPADSLVSSVSGGPPSSDCPQVGSTRCTFFALRLAMSSPGLSGTSPTSSPAASPVSRLPPAGDPRAAERAQPVRGQHPLAAPDRGQLHHAAVESLHPAGAPDGGAQQLQVQRLTLRVELVVPLWLERDDRGPGDAQGPGPPGLGRQPAPPAGGPQQSAGPGRREGDPAQHEDQDGEAGDRDPPSRLTRDPGGRDREEDPEDDGDDPAAQPAQRTRLVRGEGHAGLRVIQGGHPRMLPEDPVAATT